METFPKSYYEEDVAKERAVTATYDYQLGAMGGAARGFELCFGVLLPAAPSRSAQSP